MSFNFFADEVAFREQTDRQARMAGVTGPSFRCVACGRRSAMKGCKRTAAGSICAACHQAREARRACQNGAQAATSSRVVAEGVRGENKAPEGVLAGRKVEGAR